MGLPIITKADLRRVLEDALASTGKEDLRDIRRCCAVLSPEDVRLALHEAAIAATKAQS